MSKAHKWRAAYIFFALLAIGLIVWLVMFALRENINLFYTPAELINDKSNAIVRLGGIVLAGSVVYGDNLDIRFTITDNQADIPVQYRGVLPDLFREERSVVAQGQLIDQVFYADQILAKHDENYTPPELMPKTRT